MTTQQHSTTLSGVSTSKQAPTTAGKPRPTNSTVQRAPTHAAPILQHSKARACFQCRHTQLLLCNIRKQGRVSSADTRSSYSATFESKGVFPVPTHAAPTLQHSKARACFQCRQTHLSSQWIRGSTQAFHTRVQHVYITYTDCVDMGLEHMLWVSQYLYSTRAQCERNVVSLKFDG